MLPSHEFLAHAVGLSQSRAAISLAQENVGNKIEKTVTHLVFLVAFSVVAYRPSQTRPLPILPNPRHRAQKHPLLQKNGNRILMLTLLRLNEDYNIETQEEHCLDARLSQPSPAPALDVEASRLRQLSLSCSAYD